MTLPADEVKAITAKLLNRSRADTCTIRMNGGDSSNLRFAKNSATSNGRETQLSVTIKSSFGGCSGSVTTAGSDEAGLTAALARSEEIARLMPPNPEFMPPLGPQDYEPAQLFDEASASIPAVRLAESADAVIASARAHGLDSSGYACAGRGFSALATSAGLFAYTRHTGGSLTATCRNPAGTWSGWAGASAIRFGDIDAAGIAALAAEKAAHAAVPLDLDPGVYTVILEPAAVAELVHFLMWSLDARHADEGRSFLSKKGGGNRLGEQLFDSRVTITSDPAGSLCPDRPVGPDGLPRRRRVWVGDGMVKTMAVSRYWAQKQGYEAVPGPVSAVMSGGSVSVEDMIRDTKRGILVTRFWYTNFLDPRTLLLTGLTRDGNFYIENGRIAGPARNLRFNESIITALKNIEAMGPSVRAGDDGFGGGGVAAPPLLLKAFNFSSRSGGI